MMYMDAEMNVLGGIFRLTQQTQQRGGLYMLEALKFFTRYVLILSTIIGLVFMVVCTVFIITSVLHGDIKINIVRNKADKKNS